MVKKKLRDNIELLRFLLENISKKSIRMHLVKILNSFIIINNVIENNLDLKSTVSAELGNILLHVCQLENER